MKSGPKVDPKQVSKVNKDNKDEMIRKGLCFICSERGHVAKQCKQGKQVNACTIDPTPTRQSITPIKSRNQHEMTSVSRIEVGESTDIANNKSVSSLDESMASYIIDADEFHVRSYVDVKIDGLPEQKALIDGGSEICCIKADLVNDLNLPVCKQVGLSGLDGKSNIVNVVRLHVKPACNTNESIVNIAPSIRVWFAVVPELNESVILTPNVVSLLQNVVRYNVLSVNATVNDDNNVECSETTDHQSHVSQLAAVNDIHSSKSINDQTGVASLNENLTSGKIR
jgi:hypothetical protein